MLVGIAIIVLNYMGLMPFTGGQTEGAFLWVGLGAIALGFLAATQWR
jgi:LPXTG-motif cell wall-anchored protein